MSWTVKLTVKWKVLPWPGSFSTQMVISGNTRTGVFDSKMQPSDTRLARLFGHGDKNLAPYCELNGIANQVNQNLANPAGIANKDLGHIRLHFVDELQSFLLSAKS